MKTAAVVIALALAAAPAAAAIVATTSNDAGGQIVLTDIAGECRAGSKVAFTRAPGGRSAFGCWTYMEGFIVVRYNDGDMRTYNANDFVVTKQAKGQQL